MGVKILTEGISRSLLRWGFELMSVRCTNKYMYKYDIKKYANKP